MNRLAGLLLVIGLSSVSVWAEAKVLDVPETFQEQNQWCWAGVSAAVLAYYDTPLAQCVIAEYTRTVAAWHDFGSVDCCVDPSQGCNYWNYNWGSAGSIQDILTHWGVASYGTGRALTENECTTMIDDNRPWVVRWGWDGGGGHFVVGHGMDASTMHYMDPWFGEGFKTATYDWVVRGGTHTWTHTNVITEAHCDCASNDACCDGCSVINEGGACDDGDACTQSDACSQGSCQAGSPVICQSMDQCHTVGVCDPASGVCSDPVLGDGSACDDGQACTQNDTCQQGICMPGAPPDCSAPDDCHLAGTCDPQTGQCQFPARADGSVCDDGDLCTQVDTCQTGACLGGQAITCPRLDDCHADGACVPATGLCEFPVLSDGTVCDDQNLCTRTDVCQGGTCYGADPVACPPPDDCHLDGACLPGTGQCQYPVQVDGTTCQDGDMCTRIDSCQVGVCIGADPVVCPAPRTCHAQGSCDPASGVCDDPLASEGSACDDANPCTDQDACRTGACQPGDPVTDWTECGQSDDACFSAICEPVPDGDVCEQALILQVGTPLDVDLSGFHAWMGADLPCTDSPFAGRDVFFMAELEPGYTYSLLLTPAPVGEFLAVTRDSCDGSACLLSELAPGGESGAELLAASVEQDSRHIFQLVLAEGSNLASVRVELLAVEEVTGCDGCSTQRARGAGLAWLGLFLLALGRRRIS